MRSIPSLLILAMALAACGGAETHPKAATPEATSVPTTAAPIPSATPAEAPASTASVSPAPAASAPAGPAARPRRIGARHILIQWMGCQSASSSVIRTRDQAHAVAVDVLRRLKAGEDFARLVVEFSDEPNAGARGGSLGRFGHGAMVREFDDAAFALEPGQISDIVESPFGFHLIQRTE